MTIMRCGTQIPHDRHYRTFIRFSTLAVNPGIHKNWIPGSRPGMTGGGGEATNAAVTKPHFPSSLKCVSVLATESHQ